MINNIMKIFQLPAFNFIHLNVCSSSYILNKNDDISIMMMIFKIIFYLIIFIAIILLAYLWTKFIAKKTSYISKSNNMELIEAIKIGNNLQILIIKISNFAYIVGTNNNSLTLIDKIPYENLIIEEDKDKADALVFNKYLEKFLSSLKSKNEDFKDKMDFSNINDRLLNIKSKVSEIKNTKITSNKNDEDDENEEI